jgi:hypothetical protein
MAELTYENLIASIKAEIEKPKVVLEMKYTHQHLHWAIEAGREAERERIIKLLEEDTLKFLGCGCCAEVGLDDFIALIKGENK